MKRRKNLYVLAFLALSVLFVSVRAQQQDVPEPVFLNFSIQPPYVPTYHGRDPFKPLDNVERSPQISIADLEFHGVMNIGGTSMGLFTWRGNSSVRYILKYRKLYGGGDTVIDGVVGDILDGSIVLVQGDQRIVYPRK